MAQLRDFLAERGVRSARLLDDVSHDYRQLERSKVAELLASSLERPTRR